MQELLRKKPFMGHFLDFGGLSFLEKWLLPNPDGSYPVYQVVELALEVLENLPVEISHLQDSNIAKVLQAYACDRPGMGQAISQRATHLL